MEIEIVNSVSNILLFEANEGINHESGPYTYSDEKVDYFKHIDTRKYEKIDYINDLWQIPCLMLFL